MVGRVGFEPTTIGFKVRNNVNKRLTIQPLTGALVATYARLCTTDSRKTHAHAILALKNHVLPLISAAS